MIKVSNEQHEETISREGRIYPLIDIIKLVCAFLVVLIHVYEVRSAQSVPDLLVHCFTGQAVPFFFVASGFLIGKKLGDKEYVRRYIKGMLMLYAVGC